MKHISLFALSLLLAVPAVAAQPPGEPLDLSVPAPAAAPWNAAPQETGQGDPPGTYYGDTSGNPGGARARKSPADPLWNDGSTQVWGSVSTGVGYSKGYGTGWSNAANLNVSKAFGENNQNRATLSIDVSKSDGPGFYSRHPYDPSWDSPRHDFQRSGLDVEPSRP